MPEAGDIVWLHFDPEAGHELGGHRPALVLSPAAYNGRRGMMICCPITSRIKGYVFEVVVSHDPPSAILADQIKSLDWWSRNAVFIAKVPDYSITEVVRLVHMLIRENPFFMTGHHFTKDIFNASSLPGRRLSALLVPPDARLLRA